LNLILRQQQWQRQSERLSRYSAAYQKYASKHGLNPSMPTLWQLQMDREKEAIAVQKKILETTPPDSFAYKKAKATLSFIQDRRQWIQQQQKKIHFELMPWLSHFHWEEDAGGSMTLNQLIPWWDLTRTNRKDLVSALIFGVRISLVVGIIAVAISLVIGIPIGAMAGFYGGKFDILVSRLMEIWESMPTFFMLLLVVAITQSKTIFLVIAVIGIFSWPSFSRYIRGEFFKQRNLAYIEACRSLGFPNRFIMFSHILPNAIPPLLTLLPFAIMGAITSEAGLSFLGLGEEGSCSWGVLMDEGRSAFPGESYLLWPPAILLTILLVAIALVGDATRDSLDPKLHVAG
jgi:peptide/nickel transport system permease protein